MSKPKEWDEEALYLAEAFIRAEEDSQEEEELGEQIEKHELVLLTQETAAHAAWLHDHYVSKLAMHINNLKDLRLIMILVVIWNTLFLAITCFLEIWAGNNLPSGYELFYSVISFGAAFMLFLNLEQGWAVHKSLQQAKDELEALDADRE